MISCKVSKSRQNHPTFELGAHNTDGGKTLQTPNYDRYECVVVVSIPLLHLIFDINTCANIDIVKVLLEVTTYTPPLG